MIQIQILSRQSASKSQTREQATPPLHALRNRKAFMKVREVTSGQLIVMDRHRFEIVNIAHSEQNGRSSSVGGKAPAKNHQALEKLRRSGKVTHSTYNETLKQLTILTSDQLILYDFATQCITESIKTPMSLAKLIPLPSSEDIAAKKDKKAISSYLNEPQFNFDLHPVASKDGGTCWVLEHPQKGQFIFGPTGKASQLVQAGFLAQSFVTNAGFKLNVASCVRASKYTTDRVILQVEQMVFHVENLMQIEKGLPLEVRNETAYFDIILTKEADRNLLTKGAASDLNSNKNPKFFMVTCPFSLRSVVALNFPGRFECFMVDLIQGQSVINVKTKLNRELMLSTLQAEITDANWTTLYGTNILTLSFSDGAFACIDQYGRTVRVVSSSLFNQSVIGNQEKFWVRELIQKLPVNSKFKCELPVTKWLLGDNRMIYFTGLDVQNLPVTTILQPGAFELARVPCDWRVCPVVTTGNKVVIDDNLFLESERVFINLLYAFKVNKRELKATQQFTGQMGLFQALKCGFNSVLFFLRQSKFSLAFASLKQVKEIMSAQPELESERYPQDKMFADAYTKLYAQVIKDGKIMNFSRDEPLIQNGEPLCDKSVMLRGIADLMLFRLVQTFNSTKDLLRQISTTGASKEQLKGVNLQLAEIFTLLKRVVDSFYEVDDFESTENMQTTLRDNFLTLLYRLAQQRHWAKSVSQARLKDWHSDVKQTSKLSDRPCLRILSLLLNRSIKQNSTSSSDFGDAVQCFKNQALEMTGPEYFLTAQLIRRVQAQIARSGRIVAVKLPGYLKAVELIRHNSLVDIQAQSIQAQQFNLTQTELRSFESTALKICFDVYFKDLKSLTETVANLRDLDMVDFMLYERFKNELRVAKAEGDPYRQLLSHLMKTNFNYIATLASFQYMLTQLKAFSVLTPTLSHFQSIFKLQRRSGAKTTAYPLFLRYLLRHHTKQNVIPPEISLDSKLAKLNNFLFDSLALLLRELKFGLEMNVNTLANAPSLIQGLLDIMVLNPPPDVRNKLIRDEDQERRATDEVKMDMWEIILFLWQAHCNVMAQSCTENSATKRCWQLRALGVENVTQLDGAPKHELSRQQSSISQFDEEQLSSSRSSKQSLGELNEIYSFSNDDATEQTVKKLPQDGFWLRQTGRNALRSSRDRLDRKLDSISKRKFELIGRALLDREFQAFLKRLPTVVDVYSKKLSTKLLDAQNQVAKLVDRQYLSYYHQFKDAFGLKLNYSIKIAGGSAREAVQIVKRTSKHSFNQADTSLMPNLTFVHDSDHIEESRHLSEFDASFTPVLEISKIASEPIVPTQQTQHVSLEQDEVSEHATNAIGGDISVILQRDTITASPRREKEYFFSPPLQDLLDDLKSRDLQEVVNQQLADGPKAISSAAQSINYNIGIHQGYLNEEITINRDKKLIPGFREQSAQADLDKNKLVLLQTLIEERKQIRQSKVGQGLKIVNQVIWRKQTHLLFSSWFNLRATQYVKGAQLAFQKGESDAQSSIGVSTMPTVQERRTDRGRGRHQTPNKMTDTSNEEYPIFSQRARGRSQRSPVMTVGRGRRDETDFTKLEEESYAAKFRTIPVCEDQDIDWSTRGLSPNRVVAKRDKLVEDFYAQKYLQKKDRHIIDQDRAATSRFGDSDSPIASQGAFSDLEFVYDRKNRFLDLVDHVRKLNSPETNSQSAIQGTISERNTGADFVPGFKKEAGARFTHVAKQEQTYVIAERSQSPYTKTYKLAIMLLKPDQRGFVNKYVPVDKPPKLLKLTPSPLNQMSQTQARFSRLHKMGTLIRTNASNKI